MGKHERKRKILREEGKRDGIGKIHGRREGYGQLQTNYTGILKKSLKRRWKT